MHNRLCLTTVPSFIGLQSISTAALTLGSIFQSFGTLNVRISEQLSLYNPQQAQCCHIRVAKDSSVARSTRDIDLRHPFQRTARRCSQQSSSVFANIMVSIGLMVLLEAMIQRQARSKTHYARSRQVLHQAKLAQAGRFHFLKTQGWVTFSANMAHISIIKPDICLCASTFGVKIAK